MTSDTSDSSSFYGFIPSIVALVIVLLYCIAVRVAYTWDYIKTHKGNVIVLENPPTSSFSAQVAKNHLYLIMVDTGIWQGSGTSAHVRLEIHARNYCSRVYCLKPDRPDQRVLKRGHRDIFVLNTSDCLGEVFSLTLLILTQGKSDSWFLESIKVIDVSHTNHWIFPCFRWMTTYRKPSVILKLFPYETTVQPIRHILLNRWFDLHTWVSIFCSFNRLGRLTRIERITLCANTLMTVLFCYILLLQNGWGTETADEEEEEEEKEEEEKEEKESWGFELTWFILASLSVCVLAILISYLPEIFLRDSVPLVWKFKDVQETLESVKCADCEIRNPQLADLAVLPEELMGQSQIGLHSIKCNICRQDEKSRSSLSSEEEEEEVDCTPKNPAALVANIMAGKKKRRVIKPWTDPAVVTKYYSLAEKYIRFFQTWRGLCVKLWDIVDELNAYFDKQGDCELGKHNRLLQWLLGAMEDLLKQNKILHKTVLSVEKPLEFPDDLLFPTALPTTTCGKPPSKQTRDITRLIRLAVFVILTIVMNCLDSLKHICDKTVCNLPDELVAELHHLVSTILYAIHSLVLKRHFLYQSCNGIVMKKIETMDEFVFLLLQGPTTFEFDLVPDPGYFRSGTQWLIVDKRGCVVDETAHSPLDCHITLDEIKCHVVDHSKATVMEMMTGVIGLTCRRQPLGSFSDFLRYRARATDDEPLDWASSCLDFMLPLVAVIARPLIAHVHLFIGFREGGYSTYLQIQHYLQTVILNAALQVVREMERKEGDEWRSFSPPHTHLVECESGPPSDYSMLVNRFKRCLHQSELKTVSAASQCPEGRVHIRDERVLQLLLEEGKFKPKQLACRQMLNSVEKVVASYKDRLARIEKFISQAMLTLTDSQELLVATSSCPSPECSVRELGSGGACVTSTRQQLLQLSFVVVKLFEQCNELAQQQSLGDSINPPKFWTNRDYVNLPFIQKIESFKEHFTGLDIHSLTDDKLKSIQGLAFRIHELDIGPHWTGVLYLYLLVQNFVFLGFIMAWTKHVDELTGLGALVVVIIGACLDILIFQPLKVIIVALLIQRYSKVDEQFVVRNIQERT